MPLPSLPDCPWWTPAHLACRAQQSAAIALNPAPTASYTLDTPPQGITPSAARSTFREVNPARSFALFKERTSAARGSRTRRRETSWPPREHVGALLLSG